MGGAIGLEYERYCDPGSEYDEGVQEAGEKRKLICNYLFVRGGGVNWDLFGGGFNNHLQERIVNQPHFY